MGVVMGEEQAIHIMGAGLSGLAAATVLAKAGKEVHQPHYIVVPIIVSAEVARGRLHFG